MVAWLSYYGKEGFALHTTGNQQAAPLELLSVGRIGIHEVEQGSTNTGLSAHS